MNQPASMAPPVQDRPRLLSDEPTGKRIEISEISIFRCAGGRVVEQWCIFDELARLQQLGVSEAYLRKMLRL